MFRAPKGSQYRCAASADATPNPKLLNDIIILTMMSTPQNGTFGKPPNALQLVQHLILLVVSSR